MDLRSAQVPPSGCAVTIRASARRGVGGEPELGLEAEIGGGVFGRVGFRTGHVSVVICRHCLRGVGGVLFRWGDPVHGAMMQQSKASGERALSTGADWHSASDPLMFI